MKMDCDVIRDLLPLYADEACSGESRTLVEEHLQGCPSCRDMLRKMKESEIEDDLRSEKDSVIAYGARRFRRRSAAVGSAVSGSVLIPILICLYINIVLGSSMGWVFIVLAALGVAASLIVVPILVQEDKAFWTFCAFTASLLLLFAVTCAYTRGDWFWIASSATLFGLSVIFLPFLIRARPAKRLIGSAKPVWVVLGVDIALFINMLSVVASRNMSDLRILVSRLITVAIVYLAWQYFREKDAAK